MSSIDDEAPVLLNSDVYCQLLNPDETKDVAPHPHQCKLFNSLSLLYDKRWLGTNGLRVELTCSDAKSTADAEAEFISALEESGLTATCTVDAGRAGSLTIKDVSYNGSVKPEPLIDLAKFCLWLEPDKISRMRESGEAVTKPAADSNKQLEHELFCCDEDQKNLLKVLKANTSNNKNESQAQTKGAQAWSEIDKIRKELFHLVTDARVGIVEVCDVCDRVVSVRARVSQDTKEELTARLEELKQKLAGATGATNKQRRKRLQRKVKDINQRLDILAKQNSEEQ